MRADLAAVPMARRHARGRRRVYGFKSSNPLWAASYYVLDSAYVIVFLGSLFSREFVGFPGRAVYAVCGRDGFTRDHGCGRYENLSDAILGFTFFAG